MFDAKETKYCIGQNNNNKVFEILLFPITHQSLVNF